jgi:2'-5' RNA ligase
VKESSRRLFFALWPTAKQQASLAKATRQVLQASGGRAVPESNLHVTLAFLGSVPERRLGELTAIAQRVSSSFGTAHPLQVSFDRLEYWKKAQVLCAVPGARAASHALAELAAALKTELMAAAFAPELKPFRAHVTLARKVSRRSDWPHELRAHPVPWSFTGFSLMESRTDASGALYSRVESWLLAKRISTEKA